MAREPHVGEDEEIGQFHKDELPEHERRPERPAETAAIAGDPERQLIEHGTERDEDEPAIDPDADRLPAMNRTQ